MHEFVLRQRKRPEYIAIIMKREIIKIDEELCDSCGLCIPNCHEGALQIIDDRAVLVSDLMCDGLGACIGHCPQGALTIEQREAEPYDEVAVMQEMVRKGRNVVVAHMKHLKDHQEHAFLKQGVQYLMENKEKLDFNPVEVIQQVHNHGKPRSITRSYDSAESTHDHAHAAGEIHGHAYGDRHGQATGDGHGYVISPVVLETGSACGCPGSREMTFEPEARSGFTEGQRSDTDHTAADSPAAGHAGADHAGTDQPSALRQWPVQLHLINPVAGYFQGADLLVAADCVAYAMGNFHAKHLRNKSLVIACPKLDGRQEIYQQKITALIDQSQVNTVTVLIMEVPCCGGLLQLVQTAASQAQRRVPIKAIQVGVQGQVLKEEWV
jgi:ferredoxin